MLTNLPDPEQRLKAFFQAFDDIQLVIDAEERILDYKSGDGAYLKPSVRANAFMEFKDVFPEDVHQKYKNAVHELQKGSKVALFEYHLPGSIDDLWYESRLVPIANGQTLMFVRNITREKQVSNMEIVHAYDRTIETWSRALHLRDKETEDHTNRVTVMAVQLARKLGLSDEDLIHIKRGAMLHDIGKVAIPDGILFKPGPLTEAEWTIMKQHPLIAVEILSPVSFLSSAVDIPRSHHEKWNGNGYPDGSVGKAIPLYARIFAFADVYDALTSARPYRPAWKEKEALEYIRNQSGRHFDPSIVPVFIAMISE